MQCTAYTENAFTEKSVAACSIATNLVQYLIDILNFSVADANTTVTNWYESELLFIYWHCFFCRNRTIVLTT